MLKGNNKPRTVRSDFGGEFKNAKVKHYLTSNNIKHFFAHPPLKCQLIERFNKSLKQLIYRYLHNRNTYRYIDKLAEIVHSYNQRPHRSLGSISPSQVTKANEVSLWNEMYINRPNRTVQAKASSKSNSSLRPVAKFRFKQGDLVRVSYNRHAFERSFNQRFSEEVFRVKQRYIRENIPKYLLVDLKGQGIEGGFYGPELQRVSMKYDEDLFKVDKILRRRGKGQNREVLIRWRGYPSTFDSWEKLSSVKTI